MKKVFLSLMVSIFPVSLSVATVSCGAKLDSLVSAINTNFNIDKKIFIENIDNITIQVKKNLANVFSIYKINAIQKVSNDPIQYKVNFDYTNTDQKTNSAELTFTWSDHDLTNNDYRNYITNIENNLDYQINLPPNNLDLTTATIDETIWNQQIEQLMKTNLFSYVDIDVDKLNYTNTSDLNYLSNSNIINYQIQNITSGYTFFNNALIPIGVFAYVDQLEFTNWLTLAINNQTITIDLLNLTINEFIKQIYNVDLLTTMGNSNSNLIFTALNYDEPSKTMTWNVSNDFPLLKFKDSNGNITNQLTIAI